MRSDFFFLEGLINTFILMSFQSSKQKLFIFLPILYFNMNFIVSKNIVFNILYLKRVSMIKCICIAKRKNIHFL